MKDFRGSIFALAVVTIIVQTVTAATLGWGTVDHIVIFKNCYFALLVASTIYLLLKVTRNYGITLLGLVAFMILISFVPFPLILWTGGLIYLYLRLRHKQTLPTGEKISLGLCSITQLVP